MISTATFCVCFGVLCSVSTTGNVFYIIVTLKRRNKAFYLLQINHAISGLLLNFLNIATMIELFKDSWTLGDIFCRIFGGFVDVCYTVSVVTYIASFTDKYVNIAFPVKSDENRKVSGMITTIFVWLASIVLCTLLFYAYSAQQDHKNVLRCRNSYLSDEQRLKYYVAFVFVVYITPIMIIMLENLEIKRNLRNPPKISILKVSQTVDTPEVISNKSVENELKDVEEQKPGKSNTGTDNIKQGGGDVEKSRVTFPVETVLLNTRSMIWTVDNHFRSPKKKDDQLNQNTLEDAINNDLFKDDILLIKLSFVVHMILWTPLIICRGIVYFGQEIHNDVFLWLKLLTMLPSVFHLSLTFLINKDMMKEFKSLMRWKTVGKKE